jgi:hypothetical protein
MPKFWEQWRLALCWLAEFPRNILPVRRSGTPMRTSSRRSPGRNAAPHYDSHRDRYNEPEYDSQQQHRMTSQRPAEPPEPILPPGKRKLTSNLRRLLHHRDRQCQPLGRPGDLMLRHLWPLEQPIWSSFRLVQPVETAACNCSN